MLPAGTRFRNQFCPDMTEDSSDTVQLGFDLGEQAESPADIYSLEDIRSDLKAMIAEARTISSGNLWSGQEHRFNKAVFRELCRSLPEDERKQLAFEFFEQIERIEELLAA